MRGVDVAVALVVALESLSCGRCSCATETAASPAATTVTPGQDAGLVGRPLVDGVPPAARSAEGEKLFVMLQRLREGGKTQVPFIAPTDDEERAYRAWVRAAAQESARGGPLPEPPDGFVLSRVADDADLWVLAERSDRRRGAGALALRMGPANGWIVEAPHTFFDTGTLPVAVDALDLGRARALLINTVHRYRARSLGKPGPDNSGDDDGDESQAIVESDVAHAPRSFFLAAHEELVAAMPGATTLQLHGFGSAAGLDLLVIVSAAGTSMDVNPLAARLRHVVGAASVATYPEQVRLLGGTTNVQARASARAGAAFAHVELARSLRDRMAASPELRRRVAEALVASAPAPAPAGNSR